MPETSAVLVEAIDQGENATPRFVFKIGPVPELPPKVKDKYGCPIRPISFLMA